MCTFFARFKRTTGYTRNPRTARYKIISFLQIQLPSASLAHWFHINRLNIVAICSYNQVRTSILPLNLLNLQAIQEKEVLMEFLVSLEPLVHLDLPDSKVQSDPLDHRDLVYFHLGPNHPGPNHLDPNHLDQMVGILVSPLARFEKFLQNSISSSRLMTTSVRTKHVTQASEWINIPNKVDLAIEIVRAHWLITSNILT